MFYKWRSLTEMHTFIIRQSDLCSQAGLASCKGYFTYFQSVFFFFFKYIIFIEERGRYNVSIMYLWALSLEILKYSLIVFNFRAQF